MNLPENDQKMTGNSFCRVNESECGNGSGSISASVMGLPGVSLPSESLGDDSFVKHLTLFGRITQDIPEFLIS